MKGLFISSAIIVAVIIFVILSSVMVSISLKDIEERIVKCIGMPNGDEDFARIEAETDELRQEFTRREWFLSLLISDGAIEEVENCFSDVINYSRAKSIDGVLTSGERLHNALENIRVKAEFTPKSIF